MEVVHSSRASSSSTATRSRRRTPDPLLTKAEAAEALNVSGRFIERLIAERRVRYVKLGRHVRIPESALVEFVEGGTVDVVDWRLWR